MDRPQINLSGAAYNPITLDYKSTVKPEYVASLDESSQYRDALRKFNLDARMNSEFNVITGEPRRPPQLPNYRLN